MSINDLGTKNHKPYSLSNPLVLGGVFYIPSQALLPGIHKIVLKDNELFAILDATGSSPRIYDQELGFFFKDTRYLDTWEMNINGEAATSLLADAKPNAKSYAFIMTNRDVASFDYEGQIPRDKLHIDRLLTLASDQLIEHVQVTNHDSTAHTLALDWRAGSRFHDIFEVRGMQRQKRGEVQPATWSEDLRLVTLSYLGLDGLLYETRIWSPDALSEIIAETSGALLRRHLKLGPKAKVGYKFVISFSSAPKTDYQGYALKSLSMSEHMQMIAKHEAKPRLPLPTIETDHPLVSKAFQVAASDIGCLLTERGDSQILYPDAGIPWFCAPFGRDGLITAYQLLPWKPEVTRGVLEFALANLGTKNDPFTDEEPGKVFHEARYGEMARRKEVPFIPYYGSIDATPLALILLAEYAFWTGEQAFAQRWWEAANQALGWIRTAIHASPEGFIGYKAQAGTGLRNQGWKDSGDSVMHADGTLAEPPIYLCEVQGYAYRALQSMAQLATLCGFDKERAEAWYLESRDLRSRFLKRFYDPELGGLILALDGAGRPCRVAASNQGHCLWSQIVGDQEAGQIATRLLSDDMFSGHGIRTLSNAVLAYNPLSYHNGSIWPHDNSLIAEGLRNYGHTAELARLAGGLISVVELATDSRLPELFCGFPKHGSASPVPYDVACKPQAWAAGSLFLLVKSLLGLSYHWRKSSLVFRSPLLPASLAWLEVRGLQVRGSELDLRIRRGEVAASVEILRKSGDKCAITVMK